MNIRPTTLADLNSVYALYRAVAAVPGGLVRRAESVGVESVPFDWEVEIAQGATVANAYHVPVTTGLSVISRGSQTPSGTMIDLLLRHAEEVGRDTVKRGPRSGLTPGPLRAGLHHRRRAARE